MRNEFRRLPWSPFAARALAATLLASAAPLPAQPQAPPTAEQRAAREQQLRELDRIAIVERKVMIGMRDGVRLQADIYRPRDASIKAPVVLSRTPYNFNWWDVRNGMARDVSTAMDAVRRGYAYVVQNERGRFFSEGEWDILGPPLTDADDTFSWLAAQSWSNGKVGLIGCSSTAEWQMAAASRGHPALGAMIPQGYGAGVGRVGGWYEQGNWYRGGAVQMLFIAWLYGVQDGQRPMLPRDLTREDIERVSKYWDLASQKPPVDWAQALRHLPVQDLLRAVDGPRGPFADAVPAGTGGRMIQRTPNDPAWYKGGGLYHDDMPISVPGYWFMSWYDVSVGPNLALFNHARTKGTTQAVRDAQYAVIAPVAHCSYKRATENTVVGERSMGDARLDYDAMTWAYFDRFLKGADNGVLDTLPHVRYFTMGSNRWQTSDVWPPRGAKPVTYFLTSSGRANSRLGDGRLVSQVPGARAGARDTFTYDPMKPVPSYGGNVCCTGNAVQAGAMDQQKMEERPDILVYSTDPLADGVEVSGPVEVTLFVSSNARDTDFTVKLLDVYPDGRAYNLDETIQRVRYREGYDKEVFMENGKVYEVKLGPLNTSNWFAPGHRIRVEVTSSNFPRFDRNLNTGGRNYDESVGVAALNAVHNGRQTPSRITLTVVTPPR
ncbi:MAG: CocE/NonD family hydrolase [Gemmatimonadetes bacterium]|nr:CocE/NonD family hydrolase [Gemmatimonadota bacterium]